MEQSEVVEIIQGAVIQVRSEGTLHKRGSSVEGEKWTESKYILEADSTEKQTDWTGKGSGGADTRVELRFLV